MSKCIDADKLIKKLDKMIDNIPASIDSGAGYVIDEVYNIIDSLQQEQPEVDLEKEIDKFLNETGAPYVWCNDDEQKEGCNIIAHHFYELGRLSNK